MRKEGLHQIFLEARKNPNIIFVGSDLAPGTLTEFKTELPEQFFIEGISEAHVMTMAAGLASEGNIVFVNSIASFLLRRSFEQFFLDVCCENQHVIVLGNGAGLVYGPLGHTHTICDDFAILANHPNLTILSPADANEMTKLISHAVNHPGPYYIRMAKGNEPDVTLNHSINIGTPLFYPAGRTADSVIITTGKALHQALALQKSSSHSFDVYHFSTVLPFNEQTAMELIKKYSQVIIIEEHLSRGGLGQMIAYAMARNSVHKKFLHFHLNDQSIFTYGKQEELMEMFGLGESFFKQNNLF